MVGPPAVTHARCMSAGDGGW